MVLERETIIKEISNLLALFQLEIIHRNSLKLYDINLVAEDFLCALINLVYDWELKNANGIHHDEPGIDLIDKKNRIVFQITTTKTRKKIQHSIDEFLTNNNDINKYELYMLIITGKQKNYSGTFTVSERLVFDKKDNIWDLNNVLDEIKRKPLGQQTKILEFLRTELGTANTKGTKKDNEKRCAKKMIDFLRYRRVIEPSRGSVHGGHNIYSFQYCLKSILEIKEKIILLRQEMIDGDISDESYIFIASDQMINACNIFLTKYEQRFQNRDTIICSELIHNVHLNKMSPLGLLDDFQNEFENLKNSVIEKYEISN